MFGLVVKVAFVLLLLVYERCLGDLVRWTGVLFMWA